MKCVEQGWNRHAAELRSWLCRQLSNAQDAEDVMQDLFLKALRQGDRFCQVADPRAWLFQAARNALIDRFRLKRNIAELTDDLAAAEVPAAETIDALSACLPRVLAELDASDRDVLLRCDLEGMAQKAYAAQTGLSLSAVKSRLLRARKRLRQQLIASCKVRLDASGHVDDFSPRPPLTRDTDTSSPR